MTKRKHPPRHQRENLLKEKNSLPLARAERKPLDQKRKPAPRYQRANLLKENQTQLQKSFARATGARDSNIPF